PCDRLRPKDIIGDKPFRTRILTDAELRALWLATESAGYPFGPLARLLMLTGLRRNEVARARWAELDLDKALWIIPAGRITSDAAHVSPPRAELSPLTKTRQGTSESLSPRGRRGTGRVPGFTAMKARLDALMAKEIEVADWTLHDIRRTMRTHLSTLPVTD